MEYTGQPLAEAPKYRAITEWIQSHPQPQKPKTAKDPM